jgi:hypothetical protein
MKTITSSGTTLGDSNQYGTGNADRCERPGRRPAANATRNAAPLMLT